MNPLAEVHEFIWKVTLRIRCTIPRAAFFESARPPAFASLEAVINVRVGKVDPKSDR